MANNYNQPKLNSLHFDSMCLGTVLVVRVSFQEEFRRFVFDLGGDRAPGPEGFMIVCYHRFLGLINTCP